MAIETNEISWPAFKSGINNRLLLPLDSFGITINYPKKVFDTGSNLVILRKLREAVLAVVRDAPDIGLQSIQTELGIGADRGDVPDDGVFAAVSCGSPVYDFGVFVGPTAIQFQKAKTSLENLILTLPILAEIMNLLVPQHETPGSLVDSMEIRDEIYRVEFRFNHRLVLGSRVTDPSASLNNLEVLRKLMSLELPIGSNPERAAPLAGLNADLIRRGDIKLAFEKELAGRTRTMWVILEAPWNVTQRDFDYDVFYRLGEGNSTFEIKDLHDFHTPVVLFYRDLMLARLLADLTFDMNIAGRP